MWNGGGDVINRKQLEIIDKNIPQKNKKSITTSITLKKDDRTTP
jgi:hypothetical protein